MNEINYLQAIVALLFVISLIALIGFGMRRYMPGAFAPRARRLQIVESLALGGRHRAVLLRHDEREHLVVLSEDGALNVSHSPAVQPKKQEPA